MSDEQLSAIVCDHDTMGVNALHTAVEEAGFRFAGGFTNPVDALNVITIDRPDLVVTGYDFWGMNGLELATEVRRLDPTPKVVLVLDDPSGRDHALAEGCFDVVPPGDLGALGRALVEVEEVLRTGERRSSGDRRRGADRRQHQDWSKVTHERRSGEDRRHDDRRTDGSD